MISAKRVALQVAGLALLLLLIAPAQAAEQSDSGPRRPLARLPSEPSGQIAKIKALGDNEWLELGPPAADPQWGKARGSAWGAKAFAFAPILRGAFLFGEGVHAYVKPDGHVMDDLWFYDVNAHAWICLYPGTNTKTFNQSVQNKELTIDDEGLLRDQNAQVIPVHTAIHAWGSLAYDSDRNKFAFHTGNGLGRYFLGNEKQMDEGLKLLEEQLKGKKKLVFSPWYYDVATCKFERTATSTPAPVDTGGFPQFHYLASQKQFYAVGSYTVAIYDPATNLWTDAKPKGTLPQGYDGPGCYDSKRGRVYRNDGDGGKGKGLMAYDIEANTWLTLDPKGDWPEAQNTNGAFYEYDSALDLVIVLQMRGATAGVLAYDPAANAWQSRLPLPADGPKFQFAGNTFYDPDLNAYFCHVAGDSADNGVMWAYRYKKR